METRDVVIIGSGPAGYTAAIYAARAQLECTLFTGFMKGLAGGQLMTTTEVENYPGFANGITGPDLMMEMQKQSEKSGAELLIEDVESVEREGDLFKVRGSSTELMAKTVIVATGATAKRLGVPGEEKFWNKGMSACAVCDGALPMFRNKELYVVGGGDTALEEALFLTKFASKVYIVHRRDELRASKCMQKRALENSKIEVIWDTVLEDVSGEESLQYVHLKNVKDNAVIQRPAGGLFYGIGHTPNSGFLNGIVECDDVGYIQVKNGSTATSCEGIFACGDVVDSTYRQAVTAAGTGCMAALDAERYLTHNLASRT
ncbi:MAG: Thioredoxin reductase [Chlamydiia bacterium]|nr:Thioredoxin reductase [Chlamydiia bacterium]